MTTSSTTSTVGEDEGIIELGGGWYEVNGEKVQGIDKARALLEGE